MDFVAKESNDVGANPGLLHLQDKSPQSLMKGAVALGAMTSGQAIGDVDVS
jgi:hypothetical protein